MNYKKIRLIVIVILGIGIAFLLRAIFTNESVIPIEEFESYLIKSNDEKLYSSYLDSYPSNSDVLPEKVYYWKDGAMDGASIVENKDSFGYYNDVVLMNRNQSITITVEITKSGYYAIETDYYYNGNHLLAPKFGIMIDESFPFYESRQVSLPIKWKSIVVTEEGENQKIYNYSLDRYQNDIQPQAKIDRSWLQSNFYDASYIHQKPLTFYLDSGIHNLTLISRNDDIYVGRLKLYGLRNNITYYDYQQKYTNENKYEGIFSLEAEYLTSKSDPSIKLYSDSNPSAQPFSVKNNRLNAIDAYTWDETGRSVTWEFNVEKTGLYQISFKYIQYRLSHIASFREIKINGEVPFQELNAYPFNYTTKWANVTLKDNEGKPYWIYLKAGKNNIELTSTVEPYRPIIETIDAMMTSITNLAIEIKKLTGGQKDINRDWDLITFLPDIEKTLNEWASKLEEAYRYGHTINQRNKQAPELLNLLLAANNLRDLAKKPNQIPNNMSKLNEGTTSASQYLGDLMLRITRQSLGLEKIYIHGDTKLPNPNANFFVRFYTSVRRFFLSFLSKKQPKTAPSKTIEVWVNRPRANIDLMQKMIDEMFTPKTGIHVNLSLMPNPSKLILSNAANIEPDVAMGVSNQMPYEFAIRNAAVDFRQFEGYEDVVNQFVKGAMIPYIYEEGVYGLPETQDFYITFYRTDILRNLEGNLPDTWDKVINILPKLRSLGMNYYVPLGNNNSYKSFTVTAPFYYQNNAYLYSEDGLSSAIDSDKAIDAMKLMTELFTVHDLPRQVVSFYNEFRYGTLPIGIGSSQTYLQLLIAAPEIKGNWDIGLFPGIEDSNGIINRYCSGPTTGSMIFKSSEKKDLAFEFLSWWLSTDIQKQFSNDIQTMFGKEYMWFSSNIEALRSLPVDQQHLDVILTQLEYIAEAPNVSGGYYLEREISNAWNSIVFNDENVRCVIDSATLSANREIWRKMSEFGYVVDNQKVKDYPIPSLANIDYWLKEYKND